MENELNLSKLILPAWVMKDNFTIVDRVDRIEYLQVATSLGIKEQSLSNLFLADSGGVIFRIHKMIDVGNYNSKWRFEFFNPMKKIQLLGSEITDIEIKKAASFAITKFESAYTNLNG